MDEKRYYRMEKALKDIKNWSEAYPINVFPEPDMRWVRRILEAGGVTLDAVSGSLLRRALKDIGDIANAGLSESENEPKTLIPDIDDLLHRLEQVEVDYDLSFILDPIKIPAMREVVKNWLTEVAHG